MNKISSWENAISLLKEGECLVSISFGKNATYYYYRNEKVIIRNKYLKAFLSLDEFKNDFQEGEFYLFENQEEIEIDQNDKYWRQ